MGPRAELPEREWQKILVAGLTEQGWVTNHVQRGRTSQGAWVTPTTSAGWPDLLAIRDGWLLAIEVKGPRTPVEVDQIAWLLLFAELPTARAWVLRPTDDWKLTARWIQRPWDAPATHGFNPANLPGPPGPHLLRRLTERRSGRGSRGATLEAPPPGQQPRML